MKFLKMLAALFGKFVSGSLFTNHPDPLIIEQKALKRWQAPTIALEKLLKVKNLPVPALQATCLIWTKISPNQPEEHLFLLQNILQRLPVQARASTLALANKNDFIRVGSLLISLASFRLEGFNDLAAAIQREWDQQGKSDDLAFAFFQIVESYGVSPLHAVSSQARVLVERGQHQQAEKLLEDLFLTISPPPADLYWRLIYLKQQLLRPPLRQLEVLEYFVATYPIDQRLGQAWQHIGDLCGNVLDDYQKALDAYFKAEQKGMNIPQLQAYRYGHWNAIPALRKHPDYLFPPVVAVDLETDPLPGAFRGTRVFEVAAARYKGRTFIDQFSTYIQRDFVPQKWSSGIAEARLKHAPAVDVVAQKLHLFLGNAFVIGHNLRAFDAPELEGMGVSVAQEQILDTLELARLLHPDSMRHHLALLCQQYGVGVDQATLHSALPDAQACALLFHALGDRLAQREAKLITGIRALVTPDSAFDQALLQPRNIPADPTLSWDLDAAPGLPLMITPMRGNQASQAMQNALNSNADQIVEHTDFDARYTQSLSINERTLVAVGTRTRIERILADHPQLPQVFVLPHFQTLLCPTRVRRAIEAYETSDQRLRLFCLYQASHNHDAATLYPLRLPPEALNTPELFALRQTIVEACCASDIEHPAGCLARKAVQAALETHPLLVCTHEALLRQPVCPMAETVIIDDAADLQMNLAEYSAVVLRSSQVRTWLNSPSEQSALHHFEAYLLDLATLFLPNPVYHERFPLSSLFPHSSIDTQLSILQTLRQTGKAGEKIAGWIENLSIQATQQPQSPASLHAFWVDLWFDQNSLMPQLQEWQICGLSQDLREIFHRSLWQPYRRHIIAGPALTTGSRSTRFLERSLGIPAHLPYQKDRHSRKQVFLPLPETIPPTGLLQRRKWIIQVGALVASMIRQQPRAILVTLNNKTAEEALIRAFRHIGDTAGRQLLATRLHWTVAKINERMSDPQRRSLVFASPRLRHTLLDGAVDVEISGPLRFLNKRDPLVIAHMRVFAQLYPDDGPFTAYLLPQALLELKTRLTSEANEYILCDGGLLSKSYRDDVLQVLSEHAEVHELGHQMDQKSAERFLDALRDILVQYGLGQQASVSDAELQLMLRSIWETDTFRVFPPLEEGGKSATSQKDVVRTALARKDQLVIAATGGGKSLCFQLPAIILAEEAVPLVTLVFSPLIALMSNQIEHLNRKGIFSAIMLNSTLSVEQRQEHLEGIKKGYYSIVYLAPEQIYSKKLRDVLRHREVGLVAIDEAHCLSQWGHNFRTDYFAIKKWIDHVLCQDQRREFPILALTATARKGYRDVQNEEQSDQASTVTDILEKLGLRISENEVVLSSAIRPELDFHFAYVTPVYTCPRCHRSYEYQAEIGNCPSCNYRPRTTRNALQHTITDLKKQKLLALLDSDPQKKTGQLPDLFPRWSRPLGARQRGLIYCAYQRTTEEIATFLKQMIQGLRVNAYHAGIESADREGILKAFTTDGAQGLDIVVCTNAFGMGIDVRRLGFVIHFDTPATPEAYYQEAGRAGRDSMFKDGKEQAQCILLFHPTDLEKQRLLSGQNSFSDYEIEDVYQAIRDIYVRTQGYPLQINLPDLQNLSSAARNPLHFFATTQEIAERAGVREDQVNTLLYYLEYQTTDKNNHKPLLERGAFASNIWQLRFEKNYQRKVQELPPGSRSWPLLNLFQKSEDYRLATDRFTTISAREITDKLRLSLHNLEGELLNLVRRGILQYAGSGQFKLQYPLDGCHEQLIHLENDVSALFRAINESREAFRRNERVTVNIRSLMTRLNITSLTFSQLTHFLFRYSLEVSEPSRLLEYFRRATRNRQPENYEIQLWLKRENRSPLAILRDIIACADQTLNVLTSRMKIGADHNDWYAINVFDADLDFTFDRRKKFHQQLLLLQSLGLLKYMSDPALGQTMQLTLLQPPVPLEELAIDLQSLRLQENHAKSKRKLMEQYASASQKEHYAQQFSQYFQGKEPLLARGTRELRSDLTPHQRQIAMLKEGIHVIQGPAGCGKTTILAEHVKYLVNQGVPVDHIMVATQYRSAEGHIADALKELAVEGAAAISTTINSFGNKIFLQYHHLLRKPDGTSYYGQAQIPQVLHSRYDGEEELPYINQALRAVQTKDFVSLISKQGWPWPPDVDLPRFTQDYRSNAFEEERFQAAIFRLCQYGIFPTTPPTREELLHILEGLTGSFSIAEFYAVYVTFIEVLAAQNHYTFDDQIVFALAILRMNPEILREYQRYYEHIIIDELQDFSPAKVELLMLLCENRSNIMAFGDLYQEVTFERSKSRSNGASPKGQTTTAEAFSRLLQRDSCQLGRGHSVTVNFRSTQEILDFTSSLRKPPASLRSWQDKHGQKPILMSTPLTAPADMVAAALAQIELLSAAEKESIALIFGNQNMLHPAQKFLRQQNIPFSLMDGQKTLYQLDYVKNLLLYFYLIADTTRDEDVERLLRRNIVPYFDWNLIRDLKTRANQYGMSLFEIVSSPKHLQAAKIDPVRIESVSHHITIIAKRSLDDPVQLLEHDLRSLSDGPLTLLHDHEDKQKEVEDILRSFVSFTVKDVIEEIHRHITFLEKHQGHSNLVLTTVTHSKSQEFETVFLIGIDKVFDKRLYVSVSRAKQRLFLIGDAAAFTSNRALSQIPERFYTRL
jgi:superfamily II DNA helicase RecQ/superfamily I DNA/RNA helicase/DNA polymerase III epsilon subunit-like protein